MSKAGKKVLRGLNEAIAHAEGRETGVVVHRPIDVKAVRERTGLSQEAFASRFGIEIRTLQGWEGKARAPVGPARTLLTIIDREPEAAARALRD